MYTHTHTQCIYAHTHTHTHTMYINTHTHNVYMHTHAHTHTVVETTERLSVCVSTNASYKVWSFFFLVCWIILSTRGFFFTAISLFGFKYPGSILLCASDCLIMISEVRTGSHFKIKHDFTYSIYHLQYVKLDLIKKTFMVLFWHIHYTHTLSNEKT